MNFFTYLGVTKERFVEDYLHTGLVTEGNGHPLVDAHNT